MMLYFVRLIVVVLLIKYNNKVALIGNNHGHLNGWTKTVYGKMIEKG